MSEANENEAYANEMAVLYRLMNAEVKSWPFPHLYVPDIFPADLYPALIDQLPADALGKPLENRVVGGLLPGFEGQRGHD